jgi:hypothetical protein
MAGVAGYHASACFVGDTAVRLGAVTKGRPYSHKMYHCFVQLWRPVLTLKEEHKLEYLLP